MAQQVRDVIMVGAGPAGLTASIYTARAGLKPLCIEGMQRGGQLMLTSDVENFPGFAEGVQGPELMDIMRKQAERFGTEFITDDVTRVDFSKRPFRVWVGDVEHQARSIIISTGASARWLGLESEKLLMGRGVSSCATCDGFFFRNQPVAVIGGGDSALEEALYLSKICSKVTLVHRRREFRASKIMQKRALENPKVEVIWDSVLDEIHDVKKNEVTGMTVRNVLSGEKTRIDLQAVFVAIGHTPNTGIFKGQIALDETGYISLKERSLTSTPGVFAAGDVADHTYRQAITAAGMGCMAAIDAERYLHTAS